MEGVRFITDIKTVCVEEVIEVMCDITGYTAKRERNKYRRIAVEWINDIPSWIDNKIYRFKPDARGYSIPVEGLRERFGYRYICQTSGQQHFWRDALNKIVPLYEITVTGYNKAGQATLSKGWPLYYNHQVKTEDFSAMNYTVPKTSDYEHATRVDTYSLEAYRLSTAETLEQNNLHPSHRETLQRSYNAAMALTTYLEAHSVEDDTDYSDQYRYIAQYYTRHEWGRLYNSANTFSLQTLPREVRTAALAGTACIDLESAVYSYYARLISEAGYVPPEGLSELIENKTRWRKAVAEKLTNTDMPLEVRIRWVKNAVTAIGFGAQTGDWGSVSTYIKNRDDRAAFENHKWVQDLITAKRAVVVLIKDFPDIHVHLKATPSVQNSNGSINWNRALAYLYQQEESRVISNVLRFLEQNSISVHLVLHDGLYVDYKYIRDGYALELERLLEGYVMRAERVDGYTHAHSSAYKRETERLEQHTADIAAEQHTASFFTNENTVPVNVPTKQQRFQATFDAVMNQYLAEPEDYRMRVTFAEHFESVTGTSLE